nr:hypothetical protein [Pandoravirus massiliensis]
MPIAAVARTIGQFSTAGVSHPHRLRWLSRPKSAATREGKKTRGSLERERHEAKGEGERARTPTDRPTKNTQFRQDTNDKNNKRQRQQQQAAPSETDEGKERGHATHPSPPEQKQGN